MKFLVCGGGKGEGGREGDMSLAGKELIAQMKVMFWDNFCIDRFKKQ